MKISYNWLKELLPDLQSSAAEIAELLTRHSFETEIKGGLKIDSQVKVAKIVKIEGHPKADRLWLVTVNIDGEEAQVVCGAQNIKVDDIVPYSPVGTKLKNEQGKVMVVREVEIRGVKSSGMLNSLRELGLGDDHEGVFVLPRELEIGSQLNEGFKDDVILETAITPDRAHDCMSHLGVARELAALLKLVIAEPEIKDLASKSKKLVVQVDDINDAPRYLGVVLSGIEVKPSPLWLQARLLAAGVRPINNVVDVSNYVMLEVGNPTHVFDAKALKSFNIRVRLAKQGEKLKTLDGQEHELNEDILIITAGGKPVAVAGVIGGVGSEIGAETTDILLEVANFRGYSVQKSSASLKTITESSQRYIKGLAPRLVGLAAKRAVSLLMEVAGAKLEEVVDAYPKQTKPWIIKFDPARVAAVAGVKISAVKAREILTRLGCKIEGGEHRWQVKVPVLRLDLQDEINLVEEVIRMVGLDVIPAKLPVAPDKPVALPALAQWREVVRDQLAGMGMTEVYNYSWEQEGILEKLGAPSEAGRLELNNPVSPEQKYLRQSLLPRLLGNVVSNRGELSKKFTGVERAFFEVGMAFTAGEGVVPGISERELIAGVIVGARAKQAIEVVLALLDKFGIEGADHGSPVEDIWWSGDSVLIAYGGRELGKAGLLSSGTSLAKKVGGSLAMFELDLRNLVAAASSVPKYEARIDYPALQYQAPSQYQASYRDLSVLVNVDTKVEQVQEIIERTGGELVVDVDLFDVYADARNNSDGIQENKKSLAFHIAYQSKKRTLKEEEISELHNKIVSVLHDELEAELR